MFRFQFRECVYMKCFMSDSRSRKNLISFKTFLSLQKTSLCSYSSIRLPNTTAIGRMGIFSSSWERQVDNNLFDLIDIDQFRNYRVGTLYNYLSMWVFLLLHSTLHCVDIYTCIKLLAFNSWSSEVKPTLPFNVSKWLFAGCIIFSVVLLMFGTLKGIRVYRTRNISLTYTNEFARNLCSIGSYRKFCVLNEINPSGSFDRIAFFTYFQYASSLNLLLADSPRQVINAITLWSVFEIQSGQFLTTIREISIKNRSEALILYSMTISFFIWVFFMTELFFALVFTIPVYYKILHVLQFQSLRQYVSVKVDRTVKQLARGHQKKSLERLIHSKYSYDDLLSEKPSIPNIELPALQKLCKSSTFNECVRSVPENPFSEQYTNPFEGQRERIRKPIQSHYSTPSIVNESYDRSQTFSKDHKPSRFPTNDTPSVYSHVNSSSEFASKTTLNEFPIKNSISFPPRKLPERNFSANSQDSQGYSIPSSYSEISLIRPSQALHQSSSSTSLSQPTRALLKDNSQTSLNATQIFRQPENGGSINRSGSFSSQEFSLDYHYEHEQISRDRVRSSLYERARNMEDEDYSKFKPHH